MVSFYHHLGYFCIFFFLVSFLDERIPRALCLVLYLFFSFLDERIPLQLLAEAENLPAPGFG